MEAMEATYSSEDLIELLFKRKRLRQKITRFEFVENLAKIKKLYKRNSNIALFKPVFEEARRYMTKVFKWEKIDVKRMLNMKEWYTKEVMMDYVRYCLIKN